MLPLSADTMTVAPDTALRLALTDTTVTLTLSDPELDTVDLSV